MTNGQPLWRPSEDRVGASQMYAFMVRMAEKYGLDASWTALHEWSVSRRDCFWEEMLKIAQIQTGGSLTPTSTGSSMVATKWFPNATLNFARHLLRFDDELIAIDAEDELGRTRSLTFGQLRDQVARAASGMRRLGIERGDRVAGFLPNIPEAVVAMLATASLGAIWSSCSPDFGISGVFDRFGQIKPKLLFAADGYSYNGKPISCVEKTAGILERIESIETCVVIDFAEHAPVSSGIAHQMGWSEFLDAEGVLEFVDVPFDHPLYIMYSSGTTGVPKCIVHGHGGTLLQHMKELMLHTDLRREDSLFYFTTCGWMMWNWLVSGLGVGATIVLYEGSPFYPDGTHLWEMAQRRGVSVFGTSPKFLSACENAGIEPGKRFDLAKLRAMLSTGSPLTIENFHWVYENVKADLQLASIAGGTDIISCFMLGNPVLPVYAGEIQCLGLGMDVRAFDDKGEPVIGEKGELVCCAPFPSQPTRFWNDPENAKYRKAYFEHFPGIWRHGDYVEITPHGGVIVYGRSDATLNPGGVRIGTAEIYRQVEAMDEIVDSVVVGKRTDDGDVDVCLFVVLRDGVTLDESLEKRIRRCIREGTTPRHVPKHIRSVTAVPYTISGKKVELAVGRMIHGENVANRDALANPQALDQYAGIV
ncbi:MAG: acetoacetate--CoA ligase [Phycisphaerae bacterium]